MAADMYRALEVGRSERKEEGNAEDVPKSAVSNVATSCVYR
jgi:hypothetical protein